MCVCALCTRFRLFFNVVAFLFLVLVAVAVPLHVQCIFIAHFGLLGSVILITYSWYLSAFIIIIIYDAQRTQRFGCHASHTYDARSRGAAALRFYYNIITMGTSTNAYMHVHSYSMR